MALEDCKGCDVDAVAFSAWAHQDFWGALFDGKRNYCIKSVFRLSEAQCIFICFNFFSQMHRHAFDFQRLATVFQKCDSGG